ncbi:unnamed protein product, partial [Ectocarpus sp. 4 AP-2014]
QVLLVLVRAGAEAGQGGGREERDMADERALSLRRRAEIDARMVLMIGEPDLASHSNPPSVRRIAKAAKDLAVAHYASHISRLRRWEKVLVPTQRLYRPLLTRLYFKLGVLHEMQGLVDRSLLCYQEVSALLSDMVPRDGVRFQGGRGDADRGTLGGAFLRGGADPMEQIRGVAEVVHLRLVRNHLHRSMSVEGAIRQLRRHVSAFGRPGDAAAAAASSRAGKGSPSSSSSAGWGGGEAAGKPGGGGVGEGSGWGVVPYRHHAWLSRQYLVFGEMLGAHMSQIAQSTARGVGWAGGGALGYTSPGHYYLGAALQAVRRRKTADRVLRAIDKDKFLSSLEGLEVREPLYLGESVRLVDPTNAERNLRQECRGFLDLEESKTDRVGMARSLLVKALEHCPSGEDGFRRRRVLILGHLGEESFVAERYDDALERLPPVWKTYLADGWLKLATAALRRMYVCAWRSGKARTVADMALRLSSKALRPWVPLEESKRLLAEALPLVGALEAPLEAVQSDRGFVASVPPQGPASERLEVAVDASLLLLRLSGRFSAAEASAGDGLVLRVALMSLLPLDTRLEAIEARTPSSGRGGLAFNHSALNCTIRDTQSTGPAGATPAEGNNDPPSSSSFLDQQQRSADLTLRAGGLLTANVGLCLPWSALPSSEPLRLVEARVLLTKRGGDDVAAAAAAASGVTLLVPSGPGTDIAREGGEGGAWARAPGFEAVRLVPPRARAHVRIAEPSSVLLDLTTRLLVTVSKAPVATPAADPTAKSSERSGGGSRCCGKPPHPFRGGFLHLECEPAPVPPPVVSPHSATTAAVGGGSSSQEQQQSSAAPPPARPRPERAFFWAPATTAARAGGEDPSVAVSDGKGGFLPVVVGSDGQPLEGIPLPLSSLDPSREEEEEEKEEEEVQEVTVPVWVRSETAGKVAVRARVVYGLGGKSPGAAGAAAAGGGGGGDEAEEGFAVTEWARAEVLCVRPLAMAVDVVSVPPNEGRGSRGAGGNEAAAVAAPWACERSGHTVAVKVSLTNLQEKRLVVSRIEVVPPSASSSSSSTTAAAANPASAATAAAAAAAAPAASSDGGAESTRTWATLPNGPVLHDDDAATAASGGGGGGLVALPGTGDTYTCCFAAKGEAERPAPLGKLRVTWRPDETGGGNGPTMSPATGGGEAAIGGVTEFPLPVLTARPPALSARLKAPPHARVGVEFSMSWEISNLTPVYSSMQLTTEDGGDFVWSGKRLCMLQVAPMETVSVVYRLVPIVPGHVLLPKVAVVPEREQVRPVEE